MHRILFVLLLIAAVLFIQTAPHCLTWFEAIRTWGLGLLAVVCGFLGTIGA